MGILEIATSIWETFDGEGSPDGYIVAGEALVCSGPSCATTDFWILKLNPTGGVVWGKTYLKGYPHSIQQTKDGGYIVGAGYNDFFVLKLSSDGEIIWQKSYGGVDNDSLHSLQQTEDGGYVVAGRTYSFGAGSRDFLVLKLNPDGDIIWQKTYGGDGEEGAFSIIETCDDLGNPDGYIVAGETYGFGAGESDILVLKLNSDGEIPNCSIMGSSDVTVRNTSVEARATDAALSPRICLLRPFSFVVHGQY
jgi:hypothetical protein